MSAHEFQQMPLDKWEHFVGFEAAEKEKSQGSVITSLMSLLGGVANGG